MENQEQSSAIPEKKVKRRGAPKELLFKEGFDPRRNLKGKPKGTKSFDTIFEEAIREIAKNKDLKINNPEKKLMVKGIIEALKGNFNFWKALAEFRFGKPKETIDIEGEIKTTQIKELVLTTRKILELKSNGKTIQQSSDIRISKEQIQE